MCKDAEVNTSASLFLCESDDFVFIYDFSEDNMINWFIKREGLEESELKVLNSIRDLPPVNRMNYSKMNEEIKKQLKILVAAVQFYLG